MGNFVQNNYALILADFFDIIPPYITEIIPHNHPYHHKISYTIQ